MHAHSGPPEHYNLQIATLRYLPHLVSLAKIMKDLNDGIYRLLLDQSLLRKATLYALGRYAIFIVILAFVFMYE